MWSQIGGMLREGVKEILDPTYEEVGEPADPAPACDPAGAVQPPGDPPDGPANGPQPNGGGDEFTAETLLVPEVHPDAEPGTLSGEWCGLSAEPEQQLAGGDHPFCRSADAEERRLPYTPYAAQPNGAASPSRSEQHASSVGDSCSSRWGTSADADAARMAALPVDAAEVHWLRSEQAEAARQLAAKDVQVRRLRAQVAAVRKVQAEEEQASSELLEEGATELERLRAQLRSARGAQVSSSAELQTEQQKLRDELAEAVSRAEEAAAEKKAAQAELAAARVGPSGAEHVLRARLEAAQEARNGAERMATEMAADRSAMEAEAQRVREQLRRAQTEQADATAKLSEAAKHNAEQSEELLELRAERVAALQHSGVGDADAVLEAVRTDVEQREKTLAAGRDAHAAEVQRIRAELAVAREGTEAAQEELKAREPLEAEARSLRQQLAAATEARNDAERMTAEMTAARDLGAAEVQRKQRELAAALSDAERMTADRDSEAAEVLRAQQELAEARAQLKTDADASELQRVRAELADAEERLQCMQGSDRGSSSTAEAGWLREELEEARETQASITSQLLAVQQAHAATEQRAEADAAARADAEWMASEMVAAVDAGAAEVVRMRGELVAAQAQVECGASDVRDLRLRLRQAQEETDSSRAAAESEMERLRRELTSRSESTGLELQRLRMELQSSDSSGSLRLTRTLQDLADEREAAAARAGATGESGDLQQHCSAADAGGRLEARRADEEGHESTEKALEAAWAAIARLTERVEVGEREAAAAEQRAAELAAALEAARRSIERLTAERDRAAAAEQTAAAAAQRGVPARRMTVQEGELSAQFRACLAMTADELLAPSHAAWLHRSADTPQQPPLPHEPQQPLQPHRPASDSRRPSTRLGLVDVPPGTGTQEQRRRTRPLSASAAGRTRLVESAWQQRGTPLVSARRGDGPLHTYAAATMPSWELRHRADAMQQAEPSRGTPHRRRRGARRTPVLSREGEAALVARLHSSAGHRGRPPSALQIREALVQSRAGLDATATDALVHRLTVGAQQKKSLLLGKLHRLYLRPKKRQPQLTPEQQDQQVHRLYVLKSAAGWDSVGPPHAPRPQTAR
eukprot:TRINITY_DN743_c7_g1_i1.p1 TRINITY_DN743_c7_g1~~TRINITY_DN743_c7_g1_i1.p1  ORF type:complete len:1105 (+),score=543.57 TRINITY_DN743_c7_g1_i1:185-3499(+)